MNRSHWLIGSLLVVGLLRVMAAGVACAQDDEEELEFRPGLIATFAAGDLKHERVDEDVQFVWSDGRLDSRLPVKSTSQGRWHGRLFTIVPGFYQLQVYANGKVRVELLGQAILDATSTEPRWHVCKPVETSYGYHPLTIEYTPPAENARLGLYWLGPQFQLEPVPDRHLFHEPAKTPTSKYREGELLTHALQCNACHSDGTSLAAPRAPDLKRIAGQIAPSWIIERLTSKMVPPDNISPPVIPSRRMPHFAMSTADAEAITAWLVSVSEKIPPGKSPFPAASKKESATPAKATTDPKKKPKPRTTPSADAGRLLVSSLGCIGCHQVDKLGQPTLFGGGDLSRVAEKRPSDFFARWLETPEMFNTRHRMPVFRLEPLERADLALHLASLKQHDVSFAFEKPQAEALSRGEKLFNEYRCANCHGHPTDAKAAALTKPLLPVASWKHACSSLLPSFKEPQFAFHTQQKGAIREYFQQRVAPLPSDAGQLLLAERNCLGCHARGGQPGIAPQLAGVTQALPELAARLPALTAPSLTGVGDKLNDDALAAAIELRHGARRPWLDIRMPGFKLSPEETKSLVQMLINHDRMPDMPTTPESPSDAKTVLAAQRLVTADGFGCTSCHKIGNAEPVKAPLNAHGAELTMLGDRIRKPWFDRWVRNPARIIPRMEMPAIQKPVRGVLHDDVNLQLAAVWSTLNTPGFDPPPPNPVRVVRRNNLGEPERAAILTDVIEVAKRPYLRPIVIGLTNRHNILFDLEQGGVAAWWIGDVARQRTRAKSWYWESGSTSLLPAGAFAGFRLESDDKTFAPVVLSQTRATLDSFEHVGEGVKIAYRLHFESAGESRELNIRETYTSIGRTKSNQKAGARRKIEVDGIRTQERFRAVVAPRGEEGSWTVRINGFASKQLAAETHVTISDSWGAHLRKEVVDGEPTVALLLSEKNQPGGTSSVTIDYSSEILTDEYHPVEVKLPPIAPVKLDVVPGFDTVQLPLSAEEMPTGLTWRRDGTMLFSSLKGRVCLARDTNKDGLEDTIVPLSDDFAAPYGLNVNSDSIDVINKYGLVRLFDDNGDEIIDRSQVVADDWGYTTDYHDWAVGLPRDREGRYYVAFPCQQDQRTPAAAHRRGSVIRLTPNHSERSRPFDIEHLTMGHRFPMGIAINHDQAVFVSDNQGNYTPFNELNHLQTGRRYGFINKLEVQPDFNPPFIPPAVSIPHPWTRSVNGICFLYTPEDVRKKLNRDRFGPFEGHLIGCEFNGLSLVRLSLEHIGGEYQGAIYPLSVPPLEGQPTFEGPVSCAIGPTGDIYVGNMLDSGWGGGQNTGSIVRMRPTDHWPAGIAEARSRADGFELDFTQALDRAKLSEPASYAVRSYRRIATPAYGGNDVDERTEVVQQITVAPDGRRVSLKLNNLRAGFVYELRVIGLTVDGRPLHPAEAHYSLNHIPTGSDRINHAK